MESNNTQTSDPQSDKNRSFDKISYTDILETIGAQLKNRQTSIVKRVSIISLPLIISTVVLVYSGKLEEDFQLSDATVGIIATSAFVAMLISLPWALIMGHIFKIERIIWIDAFFGNTALNSRDSWNRAKRLFWPSVWLNVLVFVRYYLLPVLALAAVAAGYFTLIALKITTFQPLVFIIGSICTPILLAFYAYFVKIRLRYLPFLFIDAYGTATFSYSSLFREAKSLNAVMRSGEFTKMMVVVLGAETAAAAINTVTGIMNRAAVPLGGAGQAAVAAAGAYVDELAAVNKSYAQEITFYVFYRLARQIQLGSTQTVNDTPLTHQPR